MKLLFWFMIILTLLYVIQNRKLKKRKTWKRNKIEILTNNPDKYSGNDVYEFDPYTIFIKVKEINSGTNGSVYQVHDFSSGVEKVGGKLTIKELKPLTNEEFAIKELQVKNIMEMQGKYSSSLIMKIINFKDSTIAKSSTTGKPHSVFLVQELIEGDTLANLMKYKFPDYSFQEILRIMDDVVTSQKEFKNYYGRISFDMKPGNFMVRTKERRAVLIDIDGSFNEKEIEAAKCKGIETTPGFEDLDVILYISGRYCDKNNLQHVGGQDYSTVKDYKDYPADEYAIGWTLQKIRESYIDSNIDSNNLEERNKNIERLKKYVYDYVVKECPNLMEKIVIQEVAINKKLGIKNY